MAKVLVLGHDTRAFLSVIRSLGRGGLEVHTAWHIPESIALRSRYVAHTHDLPPFSEHDSTWLHALTELMRRERFDLVMPCTDSSVTALQQNRAELERYGQIYVIPDRAFEVLFDKIKTNALARSVGVELPREAVITSEKDGANALERFGLPIVLKPRTSYNPDNPSTKLAVQKAYTEVDFESTLKDMLKVGPVAVQENVLGHGVGVELLLEKGSPVLQFQHVRIHEPLHGGGSSYRKAVAVDPTLLRASIDLLSPLNYTGVAMVEFKVDPTTGQWALMEVNARFWGSLPLALAAGVDFPLALYQLLVEGKRQFPQQYRIGIYCRNLLMDLVWQRQNLRANRQDPTLATRPIGRILLDTVVNVLTFREHFDTLTKDDLAPGFAEIGAAIRKAKTTVGRSSSARLQRLTFVRNRAALKASRAVAKATSVLFVCKGNICRSAFAAKWASQNALFPLTDSSGYYPKSDRASPNNAIEAAAGFGVDLNDHRSKQLDQTQIGNADVILVFDFENYTKVRQLYPESRDRVFYMGALCPTGPFHISDPWGKSVQDCACIFSEIEAVLRTVAALRTTVS